MKGFAIVTLAAFVLCAWGSELRETIPLPGVRCADVFVSRSQWSTIMVAGLTDQVRLFEYSHGAVDVLLTRGVVQVPGVAVDKVWYGEDAEGKGRIVAVGADRSAGGYVLVSITAADRDAPAVVARVAVEPTESFVVHDGHIYTGNEVYNERLERVWKRSSPLTLVRDVAVAGNAGYVAGMDGNGALVLRVLLRKVQHPIELGTYRDAGLKEATAVGVLAHLGDTFVYVADSVRSGVHTVTYDRWTHAASNAGFTPVPGVRALYMYQGVAVLNGGKVFGQKVLDMADPLSPALSSAAYPVTYDFAPHGATQTVLHNSVMLVADTDRLLVLTVQGMKSARHLEENRIDVGNTFAGGGGGSLLYIVDGNAVAVADVRLPSTPLFLGRTSLSPASVGVRHIVSTEAGVAYVVGTDGSLSVVDARNPMAPAIVPGALQRAVVTGTAVLLGEDHLFTGREVYSIAADPTHPVLVRSVPFPSRPEAMTLHQDGAGRLTAYIAAADYVFSVVGLEDPLQAHEGSRLSVPGLKPTAITGWTRLLYHGATVFVVVDEAMPALRVFHISRGEGRGGRRERGAERSRPAPATGGSSEREGDRVLLSFSPASVPVSTGTLWLLDAATFQVTAATFHDYRRLVLTGGCSFPAIPQPRMGAYSSAQDSRNALFYATPGSIYLTNPGKPCMPSYFPYYGEEGHIP